MYSSIFMSSGPISFSLACATFMMLMDLCGTRFRKQWQQPGHTSPQGRQPHQTQKEGVHLSSPFSPFIIAKIFICKLFQKGPLHHPFGCFVLEKVDEHVLQSRVAVGGGRLLGKLVEPGVLFVECLWKTAGSQKGRAVAFCTDTDASGDRGSLTLRRLVRNPYGGIT